MPHIRPTCRLSRQRVGQGRGLQPSTRAMGAGSPVLPAASMDRLSLVRLDSGNASPSRAAIFSAVSGTVSGRAGGRPSQARNVSVSPSVVIASGPTISRRGGTGPPSSRSTTARARIRDVNGLHAPEAGAEPDRSRQHGKRAEQRRAGPAPADDERRLRSRTSRFGRGPGPGASGAHRPHAWSRGSVNSGCSPAPRAESCRTRPMPASAQAANRTTAPRE